MRALDNWPSPWNQFHLARTPFPWAEEPLERAVQAQDHEPSLCLGKIMVMEQELLLHYSTNAVPRSGNHAALEHFVCDGSGHAIEKLGAHLRILAQHFYGSLLHHFPFRGPLLSSFLC